MLLLFATDGRVIQHNLVELTHVRAEQRHFTAYLILLQVNEIAGIGVLAHLLAASEEDNAQHYQPEELKRCRATLACEILFFKVKIPGRL